MVEHRKQGRHEHDRGEHLEREHKAGRAVGGDEPVPEEKRRPFPGTGEHGVDPGSRRVEHPATGLAPQEHEPQPALQREAPEHHPQ